MRKPSLSAIERLLLSSWVRLSSSTPPHSALSLAHPCAACARLALATPESEKRSNLLFLPIAIRVRVYCKFQCLFSYFRFSRRISPPCCEYCYFIISHPFPVSPPPNTGDWRFSTSRHLRQAPGPGPGNTTSERPHRCFIPYPKPVATHWSFCLFVFETKVLYSPLFAYQSTL